MIPRLATQDCVDTGVGVIVSSRRGLWNGEVAMFRAQILLLPEQHEALARIARVEGRSLSDLVREIVGQELERRERADQERISRQLAALGDIKAAREALQTRRGGRALEAGTLLTLLEVARDERDQEVNDGLGPFEHRR